MRRWLEVPLEEEEFGGTSRKEDRAEALELVAVFVGDGGGGRTDEELFGVRGRFENRDKNTLGRDRKSGPMIGYEGWWKSSARKKRMIDTCVIFCRCSVHSSG